MKKFQTAPHERFARSAPICLEVTALVRVNFISGGDVIYGCDFFSHELMAPAVVNKVYIFSHI